MVFYIILCIFKINVRLGCNWEKKKWYFEKLGIREKVQLWCLNNQAKVHLQFMVIKLREQRHNWLINEFINWFMIKN